MTKTIALFLITTLFALPLQADEQSEYLIKVTPELQTQLFKLHSLAGDQGEVEDLRFQQWVRIKTDQEFSPAALLKAKKEFPGILAIQPNYKIKLFNDYKLNQVQQHKISSQLNKVFLEDCPFPIPIPGICDDPDDGGGGGTPPTNPGGGNKKDNPDIPEEVTGKKGDDPLFNKQWGMKDIGVKAAWDKIKGQEAREITVAVIDTGVDYTHEDLVENLWRNPGEQGLDADGKDKATNGIDDDENGYIDDTIGWDFVSNDNKPYDLSVSGIELAFGGGNPGHGTHCAGNVAARGNNDKGITGVAPNVKIMSIRFLSEKGQGTTADAIKSIRYAVDNGAQILSNSWGSVGEDPKEDEQNQALREAIAYSQEKGSLFVAAAGNGHNGVGYDNDTDSRPAYPASYDHDVIVSVAAIDKSDNFGSFSNWGKKTVDLAAPGVKVFSTTVGNGYNDVVLNLFGQTVYWDGTSMATPHVAGAAALYWSVNPDKDWKDVKKALMDSVKNVSKISDKLASGGKLNVEQLMEQ